MGEYATLHNNDKVKLGTCESLYYMRADQIHHLVTAKHSDVPASVKQAGEYGYRFRFPFPDEDHIPIGTFEDYSRGIDVPGLKFSDLSEDYEHRDIFIQGAGFDSKITLGVSVVCPFGDKEPKPQVRSPFNGSEMQIVAQRHAEDGLMTVIRCRACNSMYRVPFADAERIAVAFRSAADRGECEHGHTIADRILAGYDASKLIEA